MVEGRIERRLVAILAADVAGYSRLVGEDEEATLATLKASRDIIDGLIGRHQGRIFGSAGDSVIAEFASPVEAVRCATEIQLDLDKHSANVTDERRMWFRIGVNLGDVIVEGDNLLGEGVNIAARPSIQSTRSERSMSNDDPGQFGELVPGQSYGDCPGAYGIQAQGIAERKFAAVLPVSTADRRFVRRSAARSSQERQKRVSCLCCVQ